MKKIFNFIIGALCFTTVLTGCGNATGNGALIGGGGGALLGGVIGTLVSGHGDKTKGAAIGAAIGGAVGAGTGALIGKHMDKVKAELAERQLNATIEQVKDANGLDALKITFNDGGIHFATAKADLNAAAQNNLQRLVKTMQHYNTCDLSVYGHTDSTGSDKVNDPLSVNRATSVAQYLASQGISSQIRDVLGFGSRQPVADNTTTEGKAANRRVEIYIYASEKMIKDANAGKL
ncbi:MAG: OmpA family protein [Bacteroidaceae bacterium]|nr:OmpA family protein [Bacteroidaceae bacterium]